MKEYHTRSLFKIGPFNHHAAAGIFSSAHNFSQIRKEQSMPKNNVSDPITDQEMAFGRLVLSGTMTDRQAADAVGLNPDSAAYTKSKPRVRAYMVEHRAAVQQQLIKQEADLSRGAADELRRLNLDREQILGRLWEIAKLRPETTRGSVSGQVKALTMIVAMLNFIPDRRAVSTEKKSDSAPPVPPAPANRGAGRGATQEHSRAVREPEPAPGSAAEVPPDPVPSQSFADRVSPAKAPPLPYVPLFNSVPDLGIPLPIKNAFVHPR
jgi:hypothetical protein